MDILKKMGLLLIVPAIMVGCKDENDDSDDDDSNDTTPTITCYLDKITMTGKDDQGNTETDVEKFTVNTSGEITKVESYGDAALTDKRGSVEITRDANGKLTTVVEKDEQGNVDETYTYTYTGSNITQIVEDSDTNGTPVTITYTLAYDGNGNLTDLTNDFGGEADDPQFKNITWANGNIATMDLVMGEDNGQDVGFEIKATFDSKPNASIARVLTPSSMIEVINKNNLTLVAANEAFSPDPSFSVAVGDTILYRTYTYDANDNVTQIVDHPSVFDDNDESKTITIDWDCQ